ncbi:MAG: phosphoglycerate kinase, partial [Candidatus Woesearchaeota archaeon]
TTSIEIAREILKKKESKKIILPIDFAVAERFSSVAKSEVIDYNRFSVNQIGLDLGPKTINMFKAYLRKARTIVWNGPLGYLEWNKYSKATQEIGRYIGMLTATSICGGGETVAAIKKYHLEHEIDYVSTGGGAFLTFLTGKEMPALTALEKSCKKFKKKVK